MTHLFLLLAFLRKQNAQHSALCKQLEGFGEAKMDGVSRTTPGIIGRFKLRTPAKMA